MATRDTYEVQTWEDAPIETSPLSAARFNHIEQGIKDASDGRALKSVYDDTTINLGRKEGTDVGAFSATSGQDNTASGVNSRADGNENVASGTNSYAGGFRTIANGANQFVIGAYNEPAYNNIIFIIGNGDSEESRKNILVVDGIGNAIFSGNVQGRYNGNEISLGTLKAEIEVRFGALQSSVGSLQQQMSVLSARVTALEQNQDSGEEGGETT